jgi:hypothetical protein
MNTFRTDTISFFDINFNHPVDANGLSILQDLGTNHELQRLFGDSHNWIFYARVLPDFHRYCFSPSNGKPNLRGASLLVSSRYNVGIYSVWNTFKNDTHPLDIKNSLNEFIDWSPLDNLQGKIDTDYKREWNPRHYPFLGIRVNDSNVIHYCDEHATDIGKIFTRNLEDEEPEQINSYIKSNISKRNYERLFIRWTDALAVYGDYVDEDQYDLTLLRAAQLFETCIVVRRLLNNIDVRVVGMSRTLSIFPRLIAVDNLVQEFKEIENTFVTSPPTFWSVEGDRLLEAAYENFGIKKMVEATKNNCGFLESRNKWLKAQFIAAFAVIAYIIDKVIAFYLQ